MRNIRTLFWRSALRRLRAADGIVPRSGAETEPVREERLRAGADIPGGLALSSWRGRSGARFVVAVHPIAAVDPADCDGAVLLAVARDEAGRARCLAAASAESLVGEARRRAWLSRIGARGAVEIHVHRLAETQAARAAALADLAPQGRTARARGEHEGARRRIARTPRGLETLRGLETSSARRVHDEGERRCPSTRARRPLERRPGGGADEARERGRGTPDPIPSGRPF